MQEDYPTIQNNGRKERHQDYIACISLVPRPFDLRGSGEKAWDSLQRACLITQRIQWACSP